MTSLPEHIELTPVEEASRLWRGAVSAFEGAGVSLVSLTEALELGLRTAELLATAVLAPVRGEFPATIAAMLQPPEVDVNVERDAVHVPRVLELLDVLDTLSDPALPCTSPKLHRGWEDPRFSCKRSRETAQAYIGVTLGADERRDLLLLLACRNRIFRLPPPVRIPAQEVLAAWPRLVALVEGLRRAASAA